MKEKTAQTTVNGKSFTIHVFIKDKGHAYLQGWLSGIHGNLKEKVFSRYLGKKWDLEGHVNKFLDDFIDFIIEVSRRSLNDMSSLINGQRLMEIEILPDLQYDFMNKDFDHDKMEIAVSFNERNLNNFLEDKQDPFLIGINHEIVHCTDNYSIVHGKIYDMAVENFTEPIALLYFISTLRTEALAKFQDVQSGEAEQHRYFYLQSSENLPKLREIIRNMHKQNFHLGSGDHFNQVSNLLYATAASIPQIMALAKMQKRNIPIYMSIQENNESEPRSIILKRGLNSSNLNKYISRHYNVWIQKLPDDIYVETFRELKHMGHCAMIKAYDEACKVLQISDRNKLISWHSYKRIKRLCWLQYQKTIRSK